MVSGGRLAGVSLSKGKMDGVEEEEHDDEEERARDNKLRRGSEEEVAGPSRRRRGNEEERATRAEKSIAKTLNESHHDVPFRATLIR